MSICGRVLALVIGVALFVGLMPGSMQSTVQASDGNAIYLPVISNLYPWRSPFAIETGWQITRPEVTEKAQELGAKWIRLNEVSWREVEPIRSEPRQYNWAVLRTFEAELEAAARAGLTPIVIVDDHPSWASVKANVPCSAIKQERFADFAAFMAAVVSRYEKPPYNVQYWELGNEPDVDPIFAPSDFSFGCWGDIADPYYGGEHYGRMLQAVTPAIRRADPEAKVILGGLLLARPETTTPGHGKPERFFEGVLRSGAAPAFDIVAYHLHPSYFSSGKDYSGTDAGWHAYGGIAKGKPAFLREVMRRYGVTKPLHLNEAALHCAPSVAMCKAPTPEFFENQADFVVRMMARSLGAGVDLISWYTLEGPGWRDASLLDGAQAPRPAYVAYRELIKRTANSSLPPMTLNYTNGVEAYRFIRGPEATEIAWSLDNLPDTVSIPESKYIGAYSRAGTPLAVTRAGGNVQISVGVSPVYIQRWP